MIDKNKLKEKIQKTPSKDIMYLSISSIETKSPQDVLKKIIKFIGEESSDVVVIRKN